MIYVLLTILLLSSCVPMERKEEVMIPPPMPYKVERKRPLKGSLWTGGRNGFLYEDPKASRVGDIITVILSEDISAEREASTESSKDASNKYSVSNVLGWGKGRKFSHFFAPELETSSKSDFKGKGKIKRKDRLTGTITAIVVDVLPNGNLVIEGRKKVRVNDEDQYVVVRGIVRPEDVTSDNTVFSTKIANAEIYFYGKGSIGGRQKVGWGTKLFDLFWPF